MGPKSPALLGLKKSWLFNIILLFPLILSLYDNTTYKILNSTCVKTAILVWLDTLKTTKYTQIRSEPYYLKQVLNCIIYKKEVNCITNNYISNNNYIKIFQTMSGSQAKFSVGKIIELAP